MLNGIVTVFKDPAEVASHAAALVAESFEHAVRDRGLFTLVLAGGSTPKLLYQVLAREYKKLDWSRALLLFGDDRCVPHSDVNSNVAMVESSLANAAGIPHSSIRAFKTHLPPAQAAADYEAMLRGLFPQPGSGPDLVLLGMGADGHTLSLFPGDDAAINEPTRWCIHTKAPAPFAVPDRVTMTLPFVALARRRLFLVTGADKAPRLAAIAAGTEHPPASKVAEPLWFFDQAAWPGEV
jgi:6-phosphogluconolactonase